MFSSAKRRTGSPLLHFRFLSRHLALEERGLQIGEVRHELRIRNADCVQHFRVSCQELLPIDFPVVVGIRCFKDILDALLAVGGELFGQQRRTAGTPEELLR